MSISDIFAVSFRLFQHYRQLFHLFCPSPLTCFSWCSRGSQNTRHSLFSFYPHSLFPILLNFIGFVGIHRVAQRLHREMSEWCWWWVVRWCCWGRACLLLNISAIVLRGVLYWGFSLAVNPLRICVCIHIFISNTDNWSLCLIQVLLSPLSIWYLLLCWFAFRYWYSKIIGLWNCRIAMSNLCHGHHSIS